MKLQQSPDLCSKVQCLLQGWGIGGWAAEGLPPPYFPILSANAAVTATEWECRLSPVVMAPGLRCGDPPGSLARGWDDPPKPLWGWGSRGHLYSLHEGPGLSSSPRADELVAPARQHPCSPQLQVAARPFAPMAAFSSPCQHSLWPPCHTASPCPPVHGNIPEVPSPSWGHPVSP